MLDPIQRRRYGILALLLSLLFFGVSAAAGVGTAIRRQSVATDIEAVGQECENRLKLLGASGVQTTETEVKATWKGLDGGYQSLGSASAAAMACPGWTMSNFCMGEGCSDKGVSLTLTKASS